MVRVYRYRLYPTRAQAAAMHETLDRLRELYNAALQHRRDAYRKAGANVSAFEQMRELPGVREARPEYLAIYSQVLQDVLRRLDRAYRAFFRRVKAGDKPGFPRFKGRGRYRTFTFPQANRNMGVRIVAGGKRVRLFGVGLVKIKIHRPIEGRIKQASVTLSGDGHWYIAFCSVDVPGKPLPATGRSVGIDVGITTFAALSAPLQGGSVMVESPRPYETAQAALRVAQRRVARRKRGSRRRRKAALLLAEQSDRVVRVRRDFHHKTAIAIARAFDSIAVEDLNVKGLAGGMLAKQVHDAGWAQFTTILAAKAESAGRELFRVDPSGTSQECSGCGRTVRKGLHVRVHECPHCGLSLDRDVNAARNIHSRGQRDRGGLNGRSEDPRSPHFARSRQVGGVVTASPSDSGS